MFVRVAFAVRILRINQSANGKGCNSHKAARLCVDRMKTLLLKLDFMQRVARGEHAFAED